MATTKSALMTLLGPPSCSSGSRPSLPPSSAALLPSWLPSQCHLQINVAPFLHELIPLAPPSISLLGTAPLGRHPILIVGTHFQMNRIERLMNHCGVDDFILVKQDTTRASRSTCTPRNDNTIKCTCSRVD